MRTPAGPSRDPQSASASGGVIVCPSPALLGSSREQSRRPSSIESTGRSRLRPIPLLGDSSARAWSPPVAARCRVSEAAAHTEPDGHAGAYIPASTLAKRNTCHSEWERLPECVRDRPPWRCQATWSIL